MAADVPAHLRVFDPGDWLRLKPGSPLYRLVASTGGLDDLEQRWQLECWQRARLDWERETDPEYRGHNDYRRG